MRTGFVQQLSLKISIHAPAKGATAQHDTVLCYLSNYKVLLQSQFIENNTFFAVFHNEPTNFQ